MHFVEFEKKLTVLQISEPGPIIRNLRIGQISKSIITSPVNSIKNSPIIARYILSIQLVDDFDCTNHIVTNSC